MISETEYDGAVAEFLREKGVTRCPTVCVVPTRASLTDADRDALRRYHENREAARRARLHRYDRLRLRAGPGSGAGRPAVSTGVPLIFGPLAIIDGAGFSGPGNAASASP
jgi:hypothetical protein